MAAYSAHIARTSIVYFLNVIMLGVRGIVLIPLLLHAVGAGQYGVYVLAMSGIMYAIVLIQCGLDTSIYQYLTPVLNTNSAPVVFWTAIQTALIFACLVTVTALIGAPIFLSGQLAQVALACAFVASGQVLWSLSLTPFRCEERSGVYMGTSISITFGELILTVAAVYLSRNLATVFFVVACYHVFVALLLLGFQSTRLPFRFWKFEQFRTLIRFGLNGIVNQLIITGYFVWDRMILSVAAGLTAVAAYAPGVALGGVIFPLAGTSLFTLPTLLARQDVKTVRALKRSVLRHAIRQFSLIAIPAVVGASLISGPFLGAITTAALAPIATPVSWIACVAVLVSGFSRFPILALRADGDDRWLSRNLVANFAFFVALAASSAFLWRPSAPVLVAGSILITSLSQMLFAYHRLRRHVSYVLAPSLFMTPLVGSAAFAWLRLVLPMNGIVDVLFFVGLSVAIYIIVVMGLERVGPWDLIRFLRQPVELAQASMDASGDRDPARERIVFYSGPNHLFACAGIFYLAELARRYKIHLVLNATERSVITKPMLEALARRNVDVHWLPDSRGLKKPDVIHEFANTLVESIRPCVVFVDNDTADFNVVVARTAKQNGARVVCFQTGTLSASLANIFQTLTRTNGALWARSRGLPAEWGRFHNIAIRWLKHYWWYYVGPVFAGYPPYPGEPSIFLLRAITGRRDGEFYLAYEPGIPEIAIRDGTPADKVIPVGHPLLRVEAQRLFREVYPVPDYLECNSALLLVDFPMDVDTTAGESGVQSGWVRSWVEVTAALARNLSRSYSQIVFKPHPQLSHRNELLDELRDGFRDVPGAYFEDPTVNAIGFLSAVRIVIGEESTVLKLARYFPDLIVVSTSFSLNGKARPFHASHAGIHVFDNWRDAVAADLASLSPTNRESGCIEGADPALSVVEILEQAGVLGSAQTGDMLQ